MEPIAVYLRSSFRRIPPAAIPAILDCVLSCTTASPYSLFYEFLNEFPLLSKEIAQRSKTIDFEWHCYVGSYVAALCHFLKKLGDGHMQLFILKLWLPLLELVHVFDTGLFNEVASMFLDVVAETNNWEVLESSMIPLLLRSIGLSLGISQSEEHAIYKWSEESSPEVVFDGEDSASISNYFQETLIETDTHENFVISQSYGFPLSMSCNLLTLTVNAAHSNKHGEEVVSDLTSTTGPEFFFTGNILWDLSKLTFQVLSQSMEHRSSAIKFLLPLLLKAFARNGTFEVLVCRRDHALTRKQFFMELWKCCKPLFSLGSLERKDAYDVLSMYLSFSPLCNVHSNVNVNGREEIFLLSADKVFWDEIKRGLVDKNGFVRKQSLNILKTTLNLSMEREFYTCFPVKLVDDKSSTSCSLSKRQQWADNEAKSLGVGRISNDTGSDFSGWQRWEAFVFLYEMLEEYGIHLVEAVWNHQIMLWFRSLYPINNSSNPPNGELCGDQMATTEQIFEWLAILWERGFCHDNPQVRCLIMQSFLAIEWKNYGFAVKLVPISFVLGPLIRGLDDPVQHKDFGVKEVYSSWATDSASTFLCQYVSDMNERQHLTFLIHLASVAKSHSFGRVGLMCFANCILSASYGILKDNNYEIERFNDATNDLSDFCLNARADLLDAFRFILECSKQHFNPAYRHKVCEKILASASAVMTAVDVPFQILMHFVSSLPREYTDSGSLRHAVQKWLRCSDFQFLKAIDVFPIDFITHKHLHASDSFVAYDDEEVDAWGSQAKLWAHVLLLVVEDEKQLDPVLKFIQLHGDAICKQNVLEWVELKLLILVTSLVEELQVIQERRTSDYQMMMKRKSDSNNLIGEMNNLYLDKESMYIDKFLMIFLSLQGELVSFTKSSCSIFWMTEIMENKALPGSVRGRLGGQSQRRLSHSLCTSVLEAITSVKTLGSLLRWCVQFRTDISLDSAETFLWSLCWKLIAPPVCKSEVDAEICIAAYEACSYALKDLVSIFSPLSLDFVRKKTISSSSEADNEAVLDAFAITFISNINNVIDEGSLARTRRAILMNWKWKCLESLLSLPKHALYIGDCKKSWKFYFSITTVRQIFGDLVGSLENAGEVSVLPMLRSVRLIMEFFASKTTDAETICYEGITTEMMWLLVHSAWILHVSCNKRRVAPIAALLSSVLHYSVFRDEAMHEYDAASGPLKWFIEKVLEEGLKSPRTIRLAALHLAGLWLAYPNTLKYYMKELKLLTLYGSVAFDEDFESELAENYDARIEVSELSRSLDPNLTDGFINTELYARVSVAVLFSKLADMADLIKITVFATNVPSAVASGKMFLLELLDFVVNDRDISKELYKKYSAIHRRKVRAWQMICVLSRFIELDIVEQVISRLHTSINRNNLPSVRQYLESAAIHAYLKFPLLVGQNLVPQLRNYDLRPQALASYVFIAANVILHANKDTQFGHLDELLPPIIPLLTSHHHSLRGFTQILVYKVLQKLVPVSNSGASTEMVLEKKCFIDLILYLSDNSDCVRLRASMDRYLDTFNPTKSVSPHGIFSNRVEEFEFECVPTALMERVIDFLNEAREDLRCSMAKDAALIKNESLLIDDEIESSDILDSNKHSMFHNPKELAFDFQKKFTFSKHELQRPVSTLIEDKAYGSLLDIENEDQLLDLLLQSRGLMAQKLKTCRQQIIVFASLIDRIPNLAGLARTCEVFRAAGLAIADKSILNDKQFQLISVTAEKWVPIVEVPVRNMKLFLEKKKKDGFAILGLEQTANSVPLDQYNFSPKIVLVLGREKEGIPVEIIHMLDACIEIPQLGIVRSLNVHVSGAIALWEYTRQHRRLH